MGWKAEFIKHASLIQEALDVGGDYDLGDVAHEIVEGRCHLWPGKQSVAVTEIVNYPKKRVLSIWLAAGDMDELKVMLEKGEAFARTAGFDEIRITGRKGWQRILKDYKVDSVVLTKALK